MIPRWLKWTAMSLAVLVAAVLVAAFFVKEPLREYAERSLNKAVEGYSFQIGGLDLHPFSLSIDVNDVVVRQEAHPDPPLVSVPEIVLDARLGPLLGGKVSAEVRLQDPLVSLTHQQLEAVSAKTEQEVAQTQPSWQQKIRDMSPVEADLIIRNGEVRYSGQQAAEPIRVTALDIETRNLTNRPEGDQSYPSEVHLKAELSDDGNMEINGRANVLAEPRPAVDATFKLGGLRIADLTPLLGAYHLIMKEGTFNATGRALYGEQTIITLETFLLEGAKISYVYQEQTKSKQQRQLKRGAEQAAKAHRDPSFVFKVGHGKILGSEVGFVNRSTEPDYRLFLTDLNADLDNFSNRLEEGTGVVKVTGKFMGSGPMVVTGTFRPEKPRPDFDLAVKIVKTEVATLNDVLRAYGKVDTHHGKFALFSELTVKNSRIDGYVKPLFRDVDVYDPKKDRDKALSSKIYQAVVDGVMSLLENTPRDEVATKSDMSGPVENPQANTWQIIGKLVQNAFFNAILPGFEGTA